MLAAVLAVWLAGAASLPAADLTLTIPAPQTLAPIVFQTGANRSPSGQVITISPRCLLLDAQPWLPVMGELHYTRVPAAEWGTELRKMKAGGVDIVSTYVFWIHHEEVQGHWDWTGRRDLHRFLQACQAAGLQVVVRCGPWCHGEVRNGGLPDWVAAGRAGKTRSTDPRFLAAVQELYQQIAGQLRGELWRDGGPVIGVQLDNEYGGAPGYLLALKRLAITAGLDVPLYLKTGWPAMKRPLPPGELLPLFGAYADGFWERGLQPMPGQAWQNYTFKSTRTDTGVGDDTLGHRAAGDTAGTRRYPYLTCEIGAGMPASYHRRMNLDPRDVEAVALCQLGDGSSLMGYYMYHGGQNPAGRLTTLQESQATGYPNDLPVKNYDFNAPIGEYGQYRPQYFWLRRLNLFLHDFGSRLAVMPSSLPDRQPAGPSDLATLRWAARSDGNSGFVFVNNYQRLQPLPAKPAVRFQLTLPTVRLVVPATPVTIPADAFFFWPFNLDLDGVRLRYATAQPVCKIQSGAQTTFYFAAIPGLPACFAFDPASLASPPAQTADAAGTNWVCPDVPPGRQPALQLVASSGRRIAMVLLSQADSLACHKSADGTTLEFDAPARTRATAVRTRLLQSAGPARTLAFSPGKHPLPIAPVDADFDRASIWRLTLPKQLDLKPQPILRIRYQGDAARLRLNGRLLDDDFYCGRDFEIGLNRYAPEILTGDLRLAILPLRKDAPLYFEPRCRPDFGPQDTLLKLLSVEVVSTEVTPVKAAR